MVDRDIEAGLKHCGTRRYAGGMEGLQLKQAHRCIESPPVLDILPRMSEQATLLDDVNRTWLPGRKLVWAAGAGRPQVLEGYYRRG